MPDDPGEIAPPLCPSAQPEMTGSQVIGVIGGTATEPRVLPLREPLAVSEELLRLADPVLPTEVFRFAAPCAGSGCQHFADGECRLARRVIHILPEVTDRLPPCRIRPDCRWWRQEGRAACLRCPQIVTQTYGPTPDLVRAATPAAD
jgi:hypothetical protein